jgi:hypothetical protein
MVRNGNAENFFLAFHDPRECKHKKLAVEHEKRKKQPWMLARFFPFRPYTQRATATFRLSMNWPQIQKSKWWSWISSSLLYPDTKKI